MASQRDKGPIYDIIVRQADRSGIPREDFLRFAYIETGGNFDPSAHNRDSDARGLFQFMPGTAAEFGITGREFDATVNTEAAARLYQRNMTQITRSSERTGRPFLSGDDQPNGLDMYLAHQQGGGGYASIQSAIATGTFSRDDTRRNIMGNISARDFERVTGTPYDQVRSMSDRELASSFTEYWREKYAAISIPERGIHASVAVGAGRERAAPLADGVLERGERGADVTAMQNSLNQLGFRDSNGAALEVNSGIYGDRTAEAVRAFQAASNLEATGKADRRTRDAIAQQVALPEQQRNAAPDRRDHARAEEGITWPTPGNNRINQADRDGEGRGEFGTSRRRQDGSRYGHTGVDIQGDVGDPVIAVAGGRVSVLPSRGSAGNMVVIDHGNGRSSRYLHLDGFNVRDGQQVNAGDQIATMGRTGNTPRQGDTHLHFEYRVNGRAVDPLPYLQGAARDGAVVREAAANGVLSEGARGNEVRQLQEQLNQLGFRGADGKPLETRSGVFGPQTEHALRAFQTQRGIGVDGDYGPESRAALTAALAGRTADNRQAHLAHATTSTIDSNDGRSFVDRLFSAAQEGGEQLREAVEQRLRQLQAQGWGSKSTDEQAKSGQEANKQDNGPSQGGGR